MPLIEYVSKKFRRNTLEIIDIANIIIHDYHEQGFTLTLRQLYYQFVSRGYLDNTESNYKKLGDTVSDARRAGLIDWLAIEDRTRFVRELTAWESPNHIITAARDSYHEDLWANQNTRVEVWIEKDALTGVIENICQQHDVPYFSCRGYVSDSEMWRAAMRIVNHNNNGQLVLIIHLGDHDPSGIDMTRDIEERLSLFTRRDDSFSFRVKRIALNMDQIEQQSPPPNPAKVTDSRYADYADKYGEESWELDALEPRFITNLIDNTVRRVKDVLKWDISLHKQEKHRKEISELIGSN